MKYIGDEVVFYLKLKSIDDIHEIVRHTYAALGQIETKLYEAANSYDERYPRNFLGVKGAAWIVRATDTSEDLSDLGTNQNITFIHNVSDSLMRDFLGPDIDTGFRLRKFTHRGFLAISAELACLLNRHANGRGLLNQNIQIVDFQPMKGIWSERPYPICMYSEGWDKPSNLFRYDDRFGKPWIERLLSAKEPISRLSHIEEILRDVERLEEVERIEAVLNSVEVTDAVTEALIDALGEYPGEPEQESETHLNILVPLADFSPNGTGVTAQKSTLNDQTTNNGSPDNPSHS